MVSYSTFMVFPDRGLLNERHRYSPNACCWRSSAVRQVELAHVAYPSISGSYARRRGTESARPKPRKPRQDYNMHDRRQCLLGVNRARWIRQPRSRHVRFAPKADKYADGAKKKKQKK
jgi:hypothetical protein